jgi:hypothetical protein
MKMMRLSEVRSMMRICDQNSSSEEFWWWWRWNSIKTSISTLLFRFIWWDSSSEVCCIEILQLAHLLIFIHLVCAKSLVIVAKECSRHLIWSSSQFIHQNRSDIHFINSHLWDCLFFIRWYLSEQIDLRTRKRRSWLICEHESEDHFLVEKCFDCEAVLQE